MVVEGFEAASGLDGLCSEAIFPASLVVGVEGRAPGVAGAPAAVVLFEALLATSVAESPDLSSPT